MTWLEYLGIYGALSIGASALFLFWCWHDIARPRQSSQFRHRKTASFDLKAQIYPSGTLKQREP